MTRERSRLAHQRPAKSCITACTSDDLIPTTGVIPRASWCVAALDDPAVQALLDAPNHAVISTVNPDGSIHSTVVWHEVVDGALTVNSALGRRWPSNLDADPRVTVVVLTPDNPYDYVEVRGTATRTDGADKQIDRLTKKYLGQDRPSAAKVNSGCVTGHG